MRPNPGTEPSMAKVGWTVQSVFYGRNSHAHQGEHLYPCREAAQSNKHDSVNPFEKPSEGTGAICHHASGCAEAQEVSGVIGRKEV